MTGWSGPISQRSAAYRDELRSRVDATDEEIERNWRLIRTWDGISHELLYDWLPADRTVPRADGGEAELRLERHDGAMTLDPWPFTTPPRDGRAQTGRLLETTFTDEERMRSGAGRGTQDHARVRAVSTERPMPA